MFTEGEINQETFLRNKGPICVIMIISEGIFLSIMFDRINYKYAGCL